MSADKIHLAVVGQDPVSFGDKGCDYSWNQDFTAYRILPHRWTPGSDSSYAATQGEIFISEEYWDYLRATDPIN